MHALDHNVISKRESDKLFQVALCSLRKGPTGSQMNCDRLQKQDFGEGGWTEALVEGNKSIRQGTLKNGGGSNNYAFVRFDVVDWL